MTLGVTEVPTITHAIEPSTTIKPTLNTEDHSMEAYKKFMKNEIKLYFDRFMPKDYMDEALYKKGSEYTLSEVLGIMWTKREKLITYAIDCFQKRR